MLGGAWKQKELSLQTDDETTLLEVLSRWVVEAPVRDELGVLRILAVRATLRTLVHATGKAFGSFVANVLGLEAQSCLNPQRLPAWKQSKLAALADASILSVDALGAWYAQNPVDARLAAIAVLDACPLDWATAQATGNIGRWFSSLPPGELPAQFLEQLQISAFYVSYLADPARHQFKRAIVNQASHMLRGPQFPARQPVPGSVQSRARLTIVGEYLFPQHAMFRCYSEVLAELKEHFQVTLIAEEPSRCAEHAQLSHEHIYFPPHERDVASLANLVHVTRPDIVFYPSIGMTYWTFVLSLLRLAPLQLMSVGHPAPSCSDQIDGTLVYQELAVSPQPEYGRLITYENQPLPSPPPDGWQVHGFRSGANFVVSVNAARMKLSPAFLATVEEVLQLAPPDTQLHFFPNVRGAELMALRRELAAWFPQALVHPSTSYAEYMDALSRSDLVLQSFPFGGTNTAMDALALGIPLICMQGEDLSASVDPVLLRRTGLGTLCVSNPADYVTLASRLLTSREERDGIRQLSRSALRKLEELRPVGAQTMADAILQTWESRTV